MKTEIKKDIRFYKKAIKDKNLKEKYPQLVEAYKMRLKQLKTKI